MTLPEPIPQTPPDPPLLAALRREPHNILLFAFHLIAMLGLLALAAVIVVTTLLQMMTSMPGVPALESPLPSFLLAGALAFSGLLLIPASIHSFRAMNARPDQPAALPPLRIGALLGILAIWIVAAVIAQVFGGYGASWLFLPPLALAGMGIPVYLLFRLGVGGVGLGTRQRAWNVFGLGLVGGPALAGILELAVYLLLLLGGGIVLALKPDWQTTFTRLTTQLEQASTTDQILSLVSPYLMNPVVIILLLLVVAVVIPLVEELVKPVGVWLLRKRPPTPQEGFALGVISGAGFALLESLLAAASNDGVWGLAFVARVGGGVMHILNTGLMGWAIASCWQERRFGRLARTYGLVVFLHGLWNALTVGTIVGGLRVASSPQEMDLLGGALVGISILGLGLLASGGLALLVMLNRRMRPAPVTAPVMETPRSENNT